MPAPEQRLSAGHSRRELVASLGATVATIAGMIALFALLPLDRDGWVVGLVVGVAAIVAVVLLTVRRAARIRVSDRPLLDTVEALALVLGLVVLGFAAVHYVLARHGQFEGLETRLDAVYFTIITISTVGYGDVRPMGQGARFVVILQLIFTLTFVGASVRLLAGLGKRRHESRLE